MPATKQTPAATKADTTRKARGTSALDGLEVSLDDAQKALAVLRDDLSTGGRRLVKDVEAAIKKARRDLARTRKAIQHDLGDLGSALTPRRSAQMPAKQSPKPTAKAGAKPATKPAGRARNRTRSS